MSIQFFFTLSFKENPEFPLNKSLHHSLSLKTDGTEKAKKEPIKATGPDL